MNYRLVIHVISIFCVLFSLSLIPPWIISWANEDGATRAFGLSWAGVFLGSCACFIASRGPQNSNMHREGFMIVCLFWVLLGSFGALPYLLNPQLALSVPDAFFESVSALTTTGSTIMMNIDDLPVSIKYYRQQTQWLGGIGLVLLALSLLPYLGIGGMQLYRIEGQGSVKEQILMPRLAHTAKMVSLTYLTLTIFCTLSYWGAGMGLFNALMHSFSTVSIGGFSTHTESMNYFQNPQVWLVSCVFMVLSSVNFALHYVCFLRRTLRPYWADSELRFLFGFLLVVTASSASILLLSHTFDDLPHALIHGLFQVISIATTTGFTTEGFYFWPTPAMIILMLSCCVGGCGGSASGGIKALRIMIMFKHIGCEVRKTLYPGAVSSVKINNHKVPTYVLTSVWAFLSLYVLCFLMLCFLMSMTGLDFLTITSTVLSCLNNLGPALGQASENYAMLPASGKWILMMAMFLGRLELFAIFILMLPSYWSR